MSESDLKVVSSQELNYLWEEIPELADLRNDNMGILEEEITIPEQYNEVPSNEDYDGPYNFETFIDPNSTKDWLYSNILNKVFIMSNSKFVVEFKWVTPNEKIDFFVRAMPLYTSPQDVHKPVLRCFQHQQLSESSNAGCSKIQAMHILRSVHDSAVYSGGAERHFSVTLPLGQPQPGMDTVKHTFYFVCKNSCPSGMERRAIEVIFTLEDACGNIYGRRKVNVRVCSCPKRDKKKEEDEHRGYHHPVQGKKRKIVTTSKKSSYSDSNDTDTIYSAEETQGDRKEKVSKRCESRQARDKTSTTKFSIKVVGKQAMKDVIKYAQDRMAGEMIRRNVEEPYKRCYSELATTMKNLE